MFNYDSTITIYNCLRAVDSPENKRDVWYRTILQKCFYKAVIGKIEKENGLQMSNAYVVRIPESPLYRPYAEWCKMPGKEREKYFSCSLKDVVIRGECAEDITGKSPFTSSELLGRYKPDAFIVSAFSDNTSFAYEKHYKIGG